jgi:hypothetical protein
MSERGVFAVDRGIFDHPRLRGEKFTKVQAFLWLVAEAAWKPHPRIISGVTINLRRGQTACSLRFMAKAWGWEEPRVRRFLAGLKTDATIDVATDAGVTVVTICKYDAYQRVSLPTDAPCDASSDAVSTQERRKLEDREYKEEDTSLRSVSAKPKKQRSKPKTPIFEDTQPTERQLRDAAEEGMSLAEVRVEWREFRDNHLKHDSHFADWPAAWRTWIRKPYRKQRAQASARGTVHPFPQRRSPADDRADAMEALKTGGQHVSSLNDQRHFDLGPVIEHQGDGRFDRDVPRAIGGGAGRLSEEGFRRLASPERR